MHLLYFRHRAVALAIHRSRQARDRPCTTYGMASLKAKGDLAELKVAADLVERGYRVAIPFGEDNDFDLILIRDGQMERVQVKHTCSDGQVIQVKCYSHSLTNGRIRQTKRYTASMIDWLAVYDVTAARCFYIPHPSLAKAEAICICA
jgi:hypothetical protein